MRASSVLGGTPSVSAAPLDGVHPVLAGRQRSFAFLTLVARTQITGHRSRELERTKKGRARKWPSLKENLAGWTGLEPATSDVTGEKR